MFFTFFALTIAYLQPISSQELQIIPKTNFNLQILPSASNNLGCGGPNNLISPNNFVCTCQLSQGKNKLPTNPCACRKCKNEVTNNNIECGCQKQLDVLPRNNLGCSCQGQSHLLPLNYGRCTCNNNIGCRCQRNNFLPVNKCGCQLQNTLILPNTCGCKRQPNFLVPISNIWYESQKPNSLIPVNDIGCKCGSQNTVPSKYNIGCGCQNQQNIIPTKICGCKRVQIPRNDGYGCQNIGCKCNRQINVIPPSIYGCEYQRSLNIIPMPKTLIAYQIPSLPSENELTVSNKFSVTDLPVTTLPSELPEGFSRGKDFQRRYDLSELKSRLAEMTDLVSATAKLLSLLTKINGDNTIPFNKDGNVSITNLPVAGNDD